MPNQEPYPSNLTDTEWKRIAPLIPGPKLFGRPPRYAKRAILDAIFYVVRSGCAWRMLPHDLPPWRIVYYYFMPVLDSDRKRYVEAERLAYARARVGTTFWRWPEPAL